MLGCRPRLRNLAGSSLFTAPTGEMTAEKRTAITLKYALVSPLCIVATSPLERIYVTNNNDKRAS